MDSDEEEQQKELLLKANKNNSLLSKITLELFQDNIYSRRREEDEEEGEFFVTITYPTDVITNIEVFDKIPDIKDVRITSNKHYRGLDLRISISNKFTMTSERYKTIKERMNSTATINSTHLNKTEGETIWINQVSSYLLKNFCVNFEDVFCIKEKEQIACIAVIGKEKEIFLEELRKMNLLCHSIKNIQLYTSTKNDLMLKVTCSLKKRMREE